MNAKQFREELIRKVASAKSHRIWQTAMSIIDTYGRLVSEDPDSRQGECEFKLLIRGYNLLIHTDVSENNFAAVEVRCNDRTVYNARTTRDQGSPQSVIDRIRRITMDDKTFTHGAGYEIEVIQYLPSDWLEFFEHGILVAEINTQQKARDEEFRRQVKAEEERDLNAEELQLASRFGILTELAPTILG